MKKVVKFGGSSLANAEQFKKVGDIIRSEESRRYVVPSAPGKRFDGDIKVTDMLYGCYEAAEKGEDFADKLAAIKERYYEIIRGLDLTLSLEDEFKKIEEDFRGQAGTEYAASRGEFLNGKVMAAYLGYEFVDAAEVIRFDKKGNLLADETDKLLGKKLSKCVLNNMCDDAGTYNRGLFVRNDLTGNNWATMPVTLIEVGFMTNPTEDRLLNKKSYQKKLAKGIVAGIDEYFGYEQ